MTCSVCGAPALPLGGACVFCRSPLADGAEPPGLLDYLAGRLPGARSKRSGLFHRGPVRDFTLVVGGETFRGRLRRGRLVLEPKMEAGRWIDHLLGRVSGQASTDAELRAAISRAGWAQR